MKNGEGYPDPTMSEGIRAAERPPEAIRWMIKLFQEIAWKFGYEITGRIHFRDRTTGREWR